MMKKTKKNQSLDSAKLTQAEMAQVYGGCCGDPIDPPPQPVGTVVSAKSTGSD